MPTKGFHRGKRLVILSCRHEIYFDYPWPDRDDKLLCQKCGYKEVTVTKVTDEYYYKCTDCFTTKYFGTNGYALMVQKASLHSRKYPEHTVELRHGERLLKTYKPHTVPLPLAIPDNDPPF